MDKEVAWVNGKICLMDLALHSMFNNVTSYAGSVMEGIRVYEQIGAGGVPSGQLAIWLLEAHIDRLLASAKAYRIPHPYTRQQLIDATVDVVAQNYGHTYIRPVIFRDKGLGVNPAKVPTVVAIGTVQWGRYVSDYLHNDCASVYISSLIRPPERFFRFGQNKGAASYGAWSQPAKLEANDAEASEALLQGEDPVGRRFVIDGSGMNLCIVEKGIIVTPNPTKWNMLYGKTLEFFLEMLDRQNVTPWCFDDITRERLLAADEVFLAGTATELTPVSLVKYRNGNGDLLQREIGNGQAGPIALKMQEELRLATSGQSPEHRHLLTPVRASALSQAT